MASDVRSPARVAPEELLEHIEWMRRLARALVRDDAAADDLTQDAATAALAKPPAADRPVRPWLAGVMRNLVRMRARGEVRRARRERGAAPAADAVPTAEEMVARVETHQLLSQLVLRLDEPFRETVLLRYYEGLPAAEIARRQGIPAGTVRWRLSRALGDLRGGLEDTFEPRGQRWQAALAPIATGGAGSGVAKGALIVSTKLKIFVATAVAVALLVLGARALGLWGGGGDEGEDDPAATAIADTDDPDAAETSARPAIGLRFGSGRSGAGASVVAAPDPPGTLRLEGQVIDETNAPVGGATVAVDSNPPRETTTEADGSFAFTELLARDYTVEARAGDRYAGPVTAAVSADADPIVLRARPGASLIVEVVSTTDGGPVPGAAVELRSTLQWHAITGADGRARLDGVGPGWRVLRVDALGFATATQMIISATRDAERTITVRLAPGAAISGRVVSAAGEPVSGARVWASPTSEPFPVVDPQIDAVVTGDDGSFVLGRKAPGTYRFTAAHPQHAQATTAPIAVGTSPRDDIEVTLGEGGVVTGTVVDAEGAPLAAANVRVTGTGTLASWRLWREVTTDEQGRFRLDGLPRRALEVVALHASGSSEITRVDLTGAAKRDVELVTSIGGAIAGTVVHPDGDPVSGALVSIARRFTGALGEREQWDLRRPSTAVAGDDGRFRFAGLEDGEYVIRAARPGAPETLALHPGARSLSGEKALRVELPAETTITGTVAFADGSAPELFAIAIDDSSRTPFGGNDGAFQVVAPAGRHALSVTGPGMIPTTVSVEVDEDGSDVGTIEVKRGRSVSGRVLDADGVAVEGARVAAGRLITGGGRELNIKSEGFDVQETTTDERGHFIVSGFDERPIVIVAGHDEHGRAVSLMIPRGPNSAEVDLVLQPTGALAGKITRDGEPLSDTVIIANPIAATRSNFFVVSGPDGSYALDRLTEGEYLLTAMLGGGGMKPKDIFTRAVTVVAGERTEADLEMKSGTLSFDVAVHIEGGGPVPMAMLFAVRGEFTGTISNMETMRDQFRPEETAAMFSRMTAGGVAATFENLQPGTYTVCAIAIPANPMDRAAMSEAMGRVETFPVRCEVISLEQSRDDPLIIRVPAAWTEPAE